MANSYFSFKQFTVHHDRCAMKVTTDGCLFGAWVAREMENANCKMETALDVGTGTGLLSMMVAQKNGVAIDAVEIDKVAAEQAAENIKTSPFRNIQVLSLDAKDLLFKSYDCIFSNPPFYETELASPDKKRNIAHHSSDLDWDTLFKLITNHLTADGNFYLLLPYKRHSEIHSLLEKHGLYLAKWITVKPSTSHQPFRLLLSGQKIEIPIEKNELSIKDSAGNYTPEFTALLKDYYLYL